MKNHSLHIADAAGLHLDGIDVAQLLHDLGEASAASSAVDLFGLCLTAQRVLARIDADASNPRKGSAGEAVLLATYRAMDDDGRDRLVSFSGHLQKRFPRPLPVLTLIEGRQGQFGGDFAASCRTNMERTSDGK